jgi:hypothetical protein
MAFPNIFDNAEFASAWVAVMRERREGITYFDGVFGPELENINALVRDCEQRRAASNDPLAVRLVDDEFEYLKRMQNDAAVTRRNREPTAAEKELDGVLENILRERIPQFRQRIHRTDKLAASPPEWRQYDFDVCHVPPDFLIDNMDRHLADNLIEKVSLYGPSARDDWNRIVRPARGLIEGTFSRKFVHHQDLPQFYLGLTEDGFPCVGVGEGVHRLAAAVLIGAPTFETKILSDLPSFLPDARAAALLVRVRCWEVTDGATMAFRATENLGGFPTL